MNMDPSTLLGWVRNLLSDLGVWTTLGTSIAIILVMATAKVVINVIRG